MEIFWNFYSYSTDIIFILKIKKKRHKRDILKFTWSNAVDGEIYIAKRHNSTKNEDGIKGILYTHRLIKIYIHSKFRKSIFDGF